MYMFEHIHNDTIDFIAAIVFKWHYSDFAIILRFRLKETFQTTTNVMIVYKVRDCG